MTPRWPHTWFLLTMWATDHTLASRDFLARAGYGARVTAEEWSAC